MRAPPPRRRRATAAVALRARRDVGARRHAVSIAVDDRELARAPALQEAQESNVLVAEKHVDVLGAEARVDVDAAVAARVAQHELGGVRLDAWWHGTVLPRKTTWRAFLFSVAAAKHRSACLKARRARSPSPCRSPTKSAVATPSSAQPVAAGAGGSAGTSGRVGSRRRRGDDGTLPVR